jgi:K+-transporting ATPase KdpF subunit
MNLESLVLLIITGLVTCYLLYALLRPEKF